MTLGRTQRVALGYHPQADGERAELESENERQRGHEAARLVEQQPDRELGGDGGRHPDEKGGYRPAHTEVCAHDTIPR